MHSRAANTSGCYDDPRRKHQRHAPLDTVTSAMGDVLDLSGGGVRIHCKKRKSKLAQNQVVVVHLQCTEGTLKLPARVAWVKRSGLFGQELGLQFLDLSKGAQNAIASLAEFGFLRAKKDGMQAGASSAPRQKRTAAKMKATIDQPNYYELLGLTANASDEEIHDAYRALARQYHPDVCDEPDAATRFTCIAEAYRVLIDPQQRRKYDLRKSA
jgi:hypothetical protein